MVRLKAGVQDIVRTAEYQISIPYGSIKSKSKNTRRTNTNKISIPYGSIKSIYDDASEENLSNFNSLWFD